MIRDMYEGVVTTMRSLVGETSEFLITIGLHQGSTLSSNLFTLVIEIGANVVHRIKVGWLKWRSASGVLCDKTSTH